MNPRTPIIAVIGATTAPSSVLDAAVAVGTQISVNGFHLVCGGGPGVMEAACLGFQQGKPDASELVAIGVLPGDDSAGANPHLDLVMPTGIGLARNAVITRMSAGVISVGGGSGTLSEIAYAWQMYKPIAAMYLTGGWSEIMAGRQLDRRRDDSVFAADSPESAVHFICECIKKKIVHG